MRNRRPHQRGSSAIWLFNMGWLSSISQTLTDNQTVRLSVIGEWVGPQAGLLSLQVLLRATPRKPAPYGPETRAKASKFRPLPPPLSAGAVKAVSKFRAALCPNPSNSHPLLLSSAHIRQLFALCEATVKFWSTRQTFGGPGRCAGAPTIPPPMTVEPHFPV